MPIAISSTRCVERELAQHRERLVPLPLRLVRIDRGGRDHLAGGIDDGDLDAGAEAGIEAHGHARAGRRRQQQVAQIRGEHAHGFGLGRGPQPHAQVDVEMHLDLGAPRPAHGFHQPAVAGTPLIGDGEALHDLQLVGPGHAGGRRLGPRAGAAGRGSLPSRRETAPGCGATAACVSGSAEVEIVLELLALGLLAVAHRGAPSRRSTTSARASAPIRSASSAKRSTRIARAPSSAAAASATCLSASTKAAATSLRIVLRLCQQQFGQRLEAGFLGDLGLGAALRLERQIDVFQAPLAVGGENGASSAASSLPCSRTEFEDGGATLFQFAQVGQPLLQRAQLRVVERAGDFLAVARNERHRGAAVEQRHRRLDLLLADAKFLLQSVDECLPSEMPLKPLRRANGRPWEARLWTIAD